MLSCAGTCVCVCVSLITLGVLRGNKRLDESVGALRVEGERVAQRGQFRAFLDKCLLQSVASSMEVLLKEEIERATEKSRLQIKPFWLVFNFLPGLIFFIYF